MKSHSHGGKCLFQWETWREHGTKGYKHKLLLNMNIKILIIALFLKVKLLGGCQKQNSFLIIYSMIANINKTNITYINLVEINI